MNPRSSVLLGQRDLDQRGIWGEVSAVPLLPLQAVWGWMELLAGGARVDAMWRKMTLSTKGKGVKNAVFKD